MSTSAVTAHPPASARAVRDVAVLRREAAVACPTSVGVTEHVLDLPGFLDFPGSVERHHCFPGGLLRHTLEVVQLARATVEVSESSGRPLDRTVIFLAALLHDVGKLSAYEMHVEHGLRKVPGFTNTLHTEVGIAKARELLTPLLAAERVAAIEHCIASHHGRPEYGALCEPQTPEAWAVHLADMASALCVGGRKNRYAR